VDRIEAMSTLLAVVRTGSLSAASRQLGTPLATVSRRISELEAHLRTRLLDRSTRRVTLTDAGEAYAAACRQILEQLEEAERAASGEYRAPRGELTVTAPMVFGRLHVAPVATEFLDAHPDIALQLRLSDRVLDLQEERVDIGVRIGPLPDSSLIARRAGVVRRAIAASPDYLARRGTPETLADLTNHDCLEFAGFTRAAWGPSAGEETASSPVRYRLTMDAAEPLVAAAIAGAGIVNLFSYHVAAAVKAGSLVLLRGFAQPYLPVHLVYRGGRLLPLKVRAFLDFATPRLKARLEADLV
jgi:DNA-binding transcriptional LysR family regulator